MTSAILNSQVLPQDAASQGPAQIAAMESVEALYERYGQRIFRFLLTSLRDRDLAESLTQETFIRAWSSMKSNAQFRGESSPATWLTRIALNLVRDHTRTNRFRFWKGVARPSVDATEFAGFLPDEVSSAESALIAHQQVALVWKTVETLTERQRTVFILRFIEELSLSDIANITGMPMSTVKTHLYRGLAAIRAQYHASSSRPGKDSK
jgi:RNA polymerase sigma-70 factor (ECF subfamily)